MQIPNKFNGYSRDGRRLYNCDGGDSPAPAPSSQTVTNTSIPEYARPYVERMLGKAEAFSNTPYQKYGGERFAGFNDLQNQAFGEAQNLGPASQLGTATNMAKSAGQQFGNMSYNPTSFANQYNAPKSYQAGQFGVDGVTADKLKQYQMDAAERISGPESFSPEMAKEYMNPYMQNVVDVQKREAQRQADLASAQRAGQAAQVGAFGGSRMGLENAMANRENQRLMSDIQSTGSSAAYQTAQQQFNQQQQGKMQAALANQAAGMNVGQQNLAALLGVQQLGSQQSMQAQLANQSAAQQAQQMREASRQFGYGQNMNAAQLAAQYGLSAQQAEEQSKQFGAQYGLQALGQKVQAANTLGQLGQTQFNQQQQAMNARQQAGTQQQAFEQQKMQQQYQDFLTKKGYPQQQLSYMSDMLRGLPLSQGTQSMYQAPPSWLAQAAGIGFLGKGLGAFAEGGEVKNKPAGLAELALMRMSED